MSTTVQQQQSQQATIAVSSRAASSCTPLVPGYPWHMHRSDFEAIGAYDAYADALRGFETMTNNRIAELRHFEDIPMDTLPDDDDLWLEVSVRDLAKWTVHAWGKTKYAEILDDPQLFELGFLCYRFVAYPGCYLLEPVETTIYQDLQGNPFIIVDDDAGNYIDEMGEQCNAKDQGYSLVRRQFLYCIENVNAALAKLAGQSLPAPMKRWHSLQRKALTSETTKSTASQDQFTTSQQTSAAQGCLDDEIKGEKPGQNLLFASKYNISDTNLSLEKAENRMSVEKLSNNSVSLHSAPWSPETCVALSAQINHELFAIPAHIDEEAYNRNWRNAAQRLIEKRCADIAEPSRAWERIELHIWAMLIGQTWYAQGRTNKTPFSLRNVESNWDTVEAELRKGSWPNYEHIEYSGPPLFDECAESSSAQPEQSYAQGYTAQPVMAAQPEEPTAHYVESTAQILEVTAQSSVVEVVAGDMQNDDCAMRNEQSAQSVRTAQSEEEIAQSLGVEGAHSAQTAQLSTTIVRRKRRSPGMTQSTAQSLIDLVRNDYPMLALRMVDVALEFYLVRMQISDDQWYDLVRFDDAQSPQTQEAIEAAERYARQRNAAQSNDGYSDSQGPPGYDEVSEGGGELQ